MHSITHRTAAPGQRNLTQRQSPMNLRSNGEYQPAPRSKMGMGAMVLGGLGVMAALSGCDAPPEPVNTSFMGKGSDRVDFSEGENADVAQCGDQWIAAGNKLVVVNGDYVMEGSDPADISQADDVGVDITCDGSWIAGGNLGVLVNGQWVRDADGAVTDFSEGEGVGVDISDQHGWIAGGNLGVQVNGHWLKDSSGELLDVSQGDDVSVSLDDATGNFMASGNLGIVTGRVVDGRPVLNEGFQIGQGTIQVR